MDVLRISGLCRMRLLWCTQQKSGEPHARLSAQRRIGLGGADDLLAEHGLAQHLLGIWDLWVIG
jgi:hypothetical protein